MQRNEVIQNIERSLEMALTFLSFLKADKWSKELPVDVVHFFESFHVDLSRLQTATDMIAKLGYYEELQAGYKGSRGRIQEQFLNLIDHFLSADLEADNPLEIENNIKPLGLGN